MHRLFLLALPLLIASCTTTPVTPTTGGEAPTSAVTRINGDLNQTVTDLRLEIGGATAASATITLPPLNQDGSTNAAAYASFALPLPTSLGDEFLTRFYEVFSPGSCQQNLTGNFYARIHLVSQLQGTQGSYTSAAATQNNGATVSTAQVMYLYSDRQTYLRGTIICPAISDIKSQDVTGFDLNLTAGWNRITRTDTVGATGDNHLYVTATRAASSGTVAAELWAVR